MQPQINPGVEIAIFSWGMLLATLTLWFTVLLGIHHKRVRCLDTKCERQPLKSLVKKNRGPTVVFSFLIH